MKLKSPAKSTKKKSVAAVKPSKPKPDALAKKTKPTSSAAPRPKTTGQGARRMVKKLMEKEALVHKTKVLIRVERKIAVKVIKLHQSV